MVFNELNNYSFKKLIFSKKFLTNFLILPIAKHLLYSVSARSEDKAYVYFVIVRFVFAVLGQI